MILGPISLVDCLVFVIFLIPQLLYQAGILSCLVLAGKVLPFLSKHLNALADLPAHCQLLKCHQSSNCRFSSFENATYCLMSSALRSVKMQPYSKILSSDV